MTDTPNVTALLDPEVAQALSHMEASTQLLAANTLQNIRAARAQLPVPTLSNAVARTDHVVPNRPHASVRVHRPVTSDDVLPAIYWMHGGGLVLGSNRIDDLRFDRWCPTLGCVGASVDYALAPESQYPGPLEDCYAGLAWLHANAESLGVDGARIGIGGSSAGGGLAAALALLVRDRGEFDVAFQALIYPMLDDRQITVSSQWPDPGWSPQANRFGWSSYLGGLSGDQVPAYAAPARAVALGNLPPAFIGVGALDGFSDEDVDYATRLRHAGGTVELHVYPGAPHGFVSLTPNTGVARRAERDLAHWLERQLHPDGMSPIRGNTEA